MQIRDHWQLNPDIDFLNHGSFGACPRIVLQKQQELLTELEQDPIKFLAPERDLLPKLDEVRQTIAGLVKSMSGKMVATPIAALNRPNKGKAGKSFSPAWIPYCC